MPFARVEPKSAVGTMLGNSRKKLDDTFSVRSVLVQLQGYGLAAIALLCFFPAMFHHQEHVFIVLFAISLSFAWIAKINPIVRTTLDAPIIAFTAWVLITVPFAIDSEYSFSEWRKFMMHILFFYWAMFVVRLPGGEGTSRKVLVAVVVGSLALSFFALEDFQLRGGSWRDRQVRAAAPSSDYNWLTTYLVLSIPVLIGWLVNQSSRGWRGLACVSLAASVLAQLAAYTRAGWVAHFAQAFGCVLILRRQRLIVWFLAAVMIAATAFYALSSIGYQQETTDPWTFSARMKTWQLGLQQVLEHPVVGAGFGNDTFVRVYSAAVQADQDKGPVEKVLPALHNTFAMVVMGSGVPALLCFMWIIVAAIRQLLAGVRVSDLRQRGDMVLRFGIALAVVGFMVRNCFDYMFAGSLAALFWILLAVGLNQPVEGARSDSAA